MVAMVAVHRRYGGAVHLHFDEPVVRPPDDEVGFAPLRMHRLPPSGSGTWFSSIGSSPATKAVMIGASGLGLLGGLAATGVAHAAPVENSATRANANRSVVLFGMNETSSYEAEQIRAKLGSSAVTFIGPSSTQDKIAHRGTTYDLTTPEGRSGYAESLGLSGDRATALAKILEDANGNTRDELAQLSRVLREAERGQRVIERMILSGHSLGSSVWGDGNGSVSFTTLGKLMALFPTAAGQVQDLMLAACHTGGPAKLDTYRGMFPNLKTLWAYDGSAPGSASGAVPHILRWERGTRGNATTLDRDAARNTRKGEYVAVWTSSKGYDNGREISALEVDRASYDATASVVPGYRSGDSAVDNPQTGPLRQHYNNIQRLLGRTDLPADQRPQLEAERDFVIRLLFYHNVGKFFQTTYAQDIQAGFGELGLQAPDFSTLSRKEALVLIELFQTKLGENPGASDATKALGERLNAALVELSPAAVPEAWI
jgi:hypothetical protein